jgi:predicted amidohydrolase
VRVAAFQRRPRFNDASAVVESILVDLDWCDRKRVDLAVFPECYLHGYMLDRATLGDVAFDLAAQEFKNLLTRLSSVRSAIVLGLIERRGQPIFNSAVVMDRGVVLGVYRKMHLHRKERAFTAGSACPVFEVAGRRFGVNICYDANFPEAAAMIARQAAHLICYPLNNMLPPDVADRWRAKSIDNLRARAVETGCWVVSSDVVGTHEAMLSHGCTCIVSPDGELMARVEEGSEGTALYECN